MRIGVIGQLEVNKPDIELHKFLKNISDRGANIFIDSDYCELFNAQGFSSNYYESFQLTEVPSLDMIISIGGDGTMLRTATYVRDSGVPIMGINTGRLGFLSTIQKDDIHSLIDKIFDRDLNIIRRSVLTMVSPHVDIPIALNEISISRNDTASMITIATYINGEYLSSYWADGLIVATPTGSTGYSLSCGGPVIVPTANVLVITPIAPHNLNDRPLVISDDTEIRLKVTGREQTHLASLDSRMISVKSHTDIIIRKADYTVNLISLKTEGFIKTLRKKLLWGEDRRN